MADLDAEPDAVAAVNEADQAAANPHAAIGLVVDSVLTTYLGREFLTDSFAISFSIALFITIIIISTITIGSKKTTSKKESMTTGTDVPNDEYLSMLNSVTANQALLKSLYDSTGKPYIKDLKTNQLLFDDAYSSVLRADGIKLLNKLVQDKENLLKTDNWNQIGFPDVKVYKGPDLKSHIFFGMLQQWRLIDLGFKNQ